MIRFKRRFSRSPAKTQLPRRSHGRSINRLIGVGFTLIELLVVMAILSILMAMLLPAIKTGKDKGRQAQCMGNLRQFAIAYMQYTNEYDGWFPPGGARAGEANGWIYSSHVTYDGIMSSNVTGGGATQYQVRQGLLYPYLNSYEVYKCPGDKNRDLRGFSYSQNAAYQDRNRDRIGRWLTEVMLMCEEQRPDDGCFWYQNSGAVGSRDCLAFDRHVACSNMLFGDGHVKGIPFNSADEVAKLEDIGCFPGEEDRW